MIDYKVQFETSQQTFLQPLNFVYISSLLSSISKFSQNMFLTYVLLDI